MKLKSIAITSLMAISLASCNSTDATLGVEGTSPVVPAQAGTALATAPVPGGVSATPQNIALSAVRMRFAPIIGAPVDKVTPLSRRLSARAKEKSIAIVASTDQTATHVLKGYFSVLADGQSSTIIYVFDVLDPSGNRLHRIQGQESVPGTNATDGWAVVPQKVMETIADRTMAAFTQWLGVPNA